MLDVSNGKKRLSNKGLVTSVIGDILDLEHHNSPKSISFQNYGTSI